MKMKFLSSLFLFVCLFAGAFCGAAPQEIKPMERVLFLGDSITHIGIFVADYQLLRALRQPQSPAEVLFCGIAGDSARGALKRYTYDVLERNPDRIFVMFGMNDVNRGLYETGNPDEKIAQKRIATLNAYQKSQKELTEKLLDAGKKVILITPSPYDQYGECKAKNLVSCNEPGLEQCARIVRDLAAEKKLPVVEFFQPMTEMLKKHPELHLCGNDRVHPGHVGQLLMAVLAAQADGVPGEVASVSLNVKNPASAKVRNAHLSDVKSSADAVSFRYLPQALPLSVKTRGYRELAAVYPLEKWNREMLTIEGLRPGQYTIKADGVVLGTFSEAQLAAGINLAVLDTPSARAAASAARVVEQIRANAGKLRDIVMLNRSIREKNGNLENLPQCYEILDQWLKAREKSGAYSYYKGVLDGYKRNRPKEKEIETEMRELWKNLYHIVQPKAFEITVSR